MQGSVELTDPTPLRHSCRALMLDPDDRILLAAHIVDDEGRMVWACPGGGVESGETHLESLRRELYEEAGFQLADSADLVEVWDQQVRDPHLVPGFGGVNNHYFLVRTEEFSPSAGVLPGQVGHPAGEGIESFRWWSSSEILQATDENPIAFSPQALAVLLAELLQAESDGNLPSHPIRLGL